MARWPGMDRYFTSHQVVERKLRPLDVIKMPDDTFHFIEYVNSSGAYAVPLAAINRDIQGHTVSFTQGGRTISAHSSVQVINPLQMGGNSQEYRRYVRLLARAQGKGKEGSDNAVEGNMAVLTHGVLLGEFDESDNVDDDGRVINAGKHTPVQGMDDMAKKAAKKANGAAKRDKAPKKVRKCACGCGNETTGYFVPGHDARLHGWIKKLADGRILKNGKDAKTNEAIIPGVVLRSLELVDTKEGARAKNPHFYKVD